MCDPRERDIRRSAATIPRRCRAIYARRHQRGARRQAGRPGDHHAFLPRQFPLHLDRPGRLRIRRRAAARQHQFRRLFPRIRQRPRRRLRAAALLPQGQQATGARPGHLEIGALERQDDIKRRIEEATKYVALDQLCLSPQCGFASTEEGNVLARTSNGRSCAWSWKSPRRCGGNKCFLPRLRGRVGRVLAASELVRASNTCPLPLRFARDLPRKRGRE